MHGQPARFKLEGERLFVHGLKQPRPSQGAMGAPEATGFLNHLAVQRRVSAPTQNQALCALVVESGVGREPRAGAAPPGSSGVLGAAAVTRVACAAPGRDVDASGRATDQAVGTPSSDPVGVTVTLSLKAAK